MKYLLFILLFIIGCGSHREFGPGESQAVIDYNKLDRGTIEYNQTCEMCGTKWSVTSRDPTKEIPKTIEWCFYDGVLCVDGLVMLSKAPQNSTPPKLQRDFLNHCLECEGCRHAAFSPKKWNKIIDTIKQIREKANVLPKTD